MTEQTEPDSIDRAMAYEAAEREKFEAAMRAKHPEWAFTADPVFAYHNERTRCAWEAWIERAILADVAAPSPSNGDLRAPATLPESMSRDEMLKYYSEYSNMVAHEVIGYQRQIRELRAALAASPHHTDSGGGEVKPVAWFCQHVMTQSQGIVESWLTFEKDEEPSLKTAPGTSFVVRTPLYTHPAPGEMRNCGEKGEAEAKDAARYRWLRDNVKRVQYRNSHRMRDGDIYVLRQTTRDEADILHGATLDAAIDATLSSTTAPDSALGGKGEQHGKP